jgi:hypothetical protein
MTFLGVTGAALLASLALAFLAAFTAIAVQNRRSGRHR